MISSMCSTGFWEVLRYAQDDAETDKHARPLQRHFIPSMSVCNGRKRKRDWTKSVGAFAAGPVSSLHHRFAHFRQWHLDANDGAELGPEWPHQQGGFAWSCKFRCRFTGACTCSNCRVARGSVGQTKDPDCNPDC